MYGNWLLLPVLFPILGGLMATRIHTLSVRRRIVSVILILELLLILPVAFSNTEEEMEQLVACVGQIRRKMGYGD